MIAETHLADLPFGISRRERTVARRPLSHLDPLRLEHLVDANYQGLDLRLLTGQRQRPPPALGEQEEAPLAGLPDGSHRDVIDRIELEDRHWFKTKSRGGVQPASKRGASGRFDAGAEGKRIKVNIQRRVTTAAWRTN